MRLRRHVWLALIPLLAAAAAVGTRSMGLSQMLTTWGRRDPVAVFPSSIDFGEQEIGRRAVAQFSICNKGGSELLLHDIRADCGCSGLEREIDGKTCRLESLRVAPGQKVALAVHSAFQGQTGARGRNVLAFRTNDPTHPEATIELTACPLRGGFIVSPTRIIFGRIPQGGEVQRIVSVYDAGPQPRRIARFITTPPGLLNARLLPAAEQEPWPDGQSLVGRVEVSAITAAPGRLEGQLLIFVENEQRPPNVVPVIGQVVGDVEVMPSSVVLPRRSGNGLLYKATCMCRSPTGQAMQVTVESTPPELTVAAAPSATQSRLWNVTIEYVPGRALRSADTPGVVRLRARLPGRVSNVEIPVYFAPLGGVI